MMEMKKIKKDGKEGARRVTGDPSFSSPKQENMPLTEGIADPEVSEKPTRRKFPARQKLWILKMADACTESGSLGALLRREGLYASNLKTWRRQREEGTLSALAPKKRGRKIPVRNALQPEIDQLRKENAHLKNRLRRAESIIDVQKKISQILSLPLETQEKGENN